MYVYLSLASPLGGKALLQCCGFGGNGGVLPGNRGGGVGAETVNPPWKKSLRQGIVFP